MSVLINMEMPTSRDPATGRFLNGHNRYELLNDPTTAEWKPIEEQSGETWKDVPGFVECGIRDWLQQEAK